MPCGITQLPVVGIFLGLSKQVEPSWNKTGAHRGSYSNQAYLQLFLLTSIVTQNTGHDLHF
jgi:hypothetical protein